LALKDAASFEFAQHASVFQRRIGNIAPKAFSAALKQAEAENFDPSSSHKYRMSQKISNVFEIRCSF